MRIADCGLRNVGTKAVALRSTFRARRSSASSIPHSSFRIHHYFFVLVFCLSLTASVSAAGVWESQTSGTLAWLHAVYFVDEARGWAVGSRGALLATTDGGRTWNVRRAPTEDSLRDVYFTNEQTGWLVCDRSIYSLRTKEEPRSYLLKTVDGGESWARVEVTGADVDVLLTRVTFIDERRGWAFGEMGALYTTTNGGASWARQIVPTKHLLLGGAFLASGAGWLVGAGNTILFNPDGEQQWRAGLSPIITAARFTRRRMAGAIGRDKSCRRNICCSAERFSKAVRAGLSARATPSCKRRMAANSGGLWA
ncbi:MAG: hypothetical protein LC747_04870, partial [Acidobacteria bacterium]|nr:hypothetical protein [Acidobacteriota bacterium]